jgi:hypothetical protein
LSPGTLVRVKPDWMHQYRKPGVTTSGVVKALSPDGKIVRVRMDNLGDSYLAVEHVEPFSCDIAYSRSPTASRASAGFRYVRK